MTDTGTQTGGGGGAEGGGGGLEVSFEQIWNAAKDVATLMQNNQSVNMGSRAFACPAGLQPSQLDWAAEAQATAQYGLTWSSPAHRAGLSSGTSLRLGVTFNAGGTHRGRGKFLHEAYLWAVLDHSGLGQDFVVTGGFGDGYPRGDVGWLAGWIRVDMTYLTMHWTSLQFDVAIGGDGSASIRPM